MSESFNLTARFPDKFVQFDIATKKIFEGMFAHESKRVATMEQVVNSKGYATVIREQMTEMKDAVVSTINQAASTVRRLFFLTVFFFFSTFLEYNLVLTGIGLIPMTIRVPKRGFSSAQLFPSSCICSRPSCRPTHAVDNALHPPFSGNGSPTNVRMIGTTGHQGQCRHLPDLVYFAADRHGRGGVVGFENQGQPGHF